MRREIEGQPKCVALEQLKQRIDRQAIFPQKVDNLSEYRFTDEHRSPHLFHQRDSPFVMRIVAIEIAKQGTRVTDRDHGRRNLARAFVADNRRPARLPARSALTA
jgi:hypothetical protein